MLLDAYGFGALNQVGEHTAGGVGQVEEVIRIDQRKVVAVIARPIDSQGNEQAQYFSTVPYMSFPTDTPANTRFQAVGNQLYQFRASLFAGSEISARSLPSIGDGLLDNSDDSLDYLEDLVWAGRPWDVYVGEEGNQFESFTLVWPGKSGEPKGDLSQVVVPLEDIGRLFDQPFESRVYTPGFEPSVVFDGVNDEITFGDNLDRGTDGFICAAAFSTLSSHAGMIYGKKNGISGSAAGWGLATGSGGAVRFDVADGTQNFGAAYVPPAGYADGDRHTVAGRLDRENDVVELYYDGTLVTSIDVTGLGDLDNANEIIVGNSSFTSNEEFSGSIERVASAGDDDQVTLDAVLAAMDEPFPEDADYSLLDHFVPMDENTGTSVGDLSASGHDGTIAGGALWSGTPNGTRELEGKQIPNSWGYCREVEGAMVDTTKIVIQVHPSLIDNIVSVKDKGIELDFDATATGDIFTGSFPTAGEWMMDKSRGLVRLGSVPDGRVTITVRGDATPTYTDDPSAILRRHAANRLGIPEPQGFDDGAFSAFEPLPVGFYLAPGETTTVGQVYDQLMRSAHGWWAVGRTGLVTVGQLRVPSTSSSTLREDEIALDDWGKNAAPAAHWRDKVSYDRTWTKQTLGELAGKASLNAKERAPLVTEYRYVEDSEEELLEHFLDARDITHEYLLTDRASAQAELATLRSLFSVPGEVWEVRMATGVLQYWIGDEVTLSLNRYNQQGRIYYVIGVTETAEQGVTLTLWRPHVELYEVN